MTPDTSHTSSLLTASTGLKIVLDDCGKRFNREWIFRHFTYTFSRGTSYAVTGPNGSGKSTLLQAIAGSLHLNEGGVEYRTEEQGTRNKEQGTRKGEQGTGNKEGGIPEAIVEQSKIPDENIYRSLSIVAPYLELIEEMTAKEFLQFHSQFKPLVSSVSIPDILSVIGLAKAADKQIRYFSSGMKQRLKLAQAVFSDVPVLLLDEPCTNLDTPGYELYHTLIAEYCSGKLIIVSSNDMNEMDFCTEKISILDYK